ncbi:hypothetical protein [Chromohalobacter canadensis]|uniref:hypothetical protein n=1 Tax=Chromohalobacter canadensis TaxID=141389 RepID=UPI000BE46251|nr:hypothetical protein [Chromohalobacter canadensis]
MHDLAGQQCQTLLLLLGEVCEVARIAAKQRDSQDADAFSANSRGVQRLWRRASSIRLANRLSA